MDIFFVVTTGVVFCIGVFVMAILYYVVRILRSVDHVSRNVSEESDVLREDIALLRKKLTDEGLRLRHFSDFFEEILMRRASVKRKKRANEDVN